MPSLPPSLHDAIAPASLDETSSGAQLNDGVESVDSSDHKTLKLQKSAVDVGISTERPSFSEDRPSSSDYFDADLLRESRASRASNEDDFYEASVLPSADEEEAETAAMKAAAREEGACTTKDGSNYNGVESNMTAHSGSAPGASSVQGLDTAATARTQGSNSTPLSSSRTNLPSGRRSPSRPNGEECSGALNGVPETPEEEDEDEEEEAWLVIADDGLPEGADQLSI